MGRDEQYIAFHQTASKAHLLRGGEAQRSEVPRKYIHAFTSNLLLLTSGRISDGVTGPSDLNFGG